MPVNFGCHQFFVSCVFSAFQVYPPQIVFYSSQSKSNQSTTQQIRQATSNINYDCVDGVNVSHPVYIQLHSQVQFHLLIKDIVWFALSSKVVFGYTSTTFLHAVAFSLASKWSAVAIRFSNETIPDRKMPHSMRVSGACQCQKNGILS